MSIGATPKNTLKNNQTKMRPMMAIIGEGHWQEVDLPAWAQYAPVMDPRVIESLSPRRIEAYVLAADGDLERAIALYVWNARVSASFFLPLQCAEVCFRNKVAAAIAASYAPPWWLDPRLRATFSPETLETLLKTLERIERRGQVTDADQVYSERP